METKETEELRKTRELEEGRHVTQDKELGKEKRDECVGGMEVGALLGLFVLWWGEGTWALPAESASAGKCQRETGLQLFPCIHNHHSFLSVAKEIALGDVQGMSGQCTVETLFILAAQLFLRCCQSQLSGLLVQKDKSLYRTHRDLAAGGLLRGGS